MSDKIDWEWGDNKPDAFIAERLSMQAEIERLKAENARLFKEAYDEIAALKAEMARTRATDSSTGAPAEKTMPGSPDQTSVCSTPPGAATEMYRDPRTGMTDRERKLFPTSYREF
jgi:uncharacterized small protein (DUF1192 family)